MTLVFLTSHVFFFKQFIKPNIWWSNQVELVRAKYGLFGIDEFCL